METTPSSDKLILNYQGATFQLVNFPHQTPPPGAVAGPPIADLALGFAGAACLIYAIMDALFVAGVRYGGEKSCDKENLYLRQYGKDLIIPLESIVSVKLSPIGLGNGPRGPVRVYNINYDYNGIARSVQLSFYSRTIGSFRLSMERVKRKNPSVKMKNWAIT